MKKCTIELTDEKKLQIATEADIAIGVRPFSKPFQILAVNRALSGALGTAWGDLVRKMVSKMDKQESQR